MPFAAGVVPAGAAGTVLFLFGCAEPLVLTGRSACSDATDWAAVGVETEAAPFVDGAVDGAAGRPVVDVPFAIGARRLVDRLSISFPLTTRLSLDFLRSLVIISASCQPEAI